MKKSILISAITASVVFANDTIVGSLAHGCVANEGFMNDFSSLMSKFISDRDVAGAMQACAEIAKSNGITD